MFILKIENNSSDTLTLTQNESRYQVLGVSGLLPPSANIHTAEIAGLDGMKYKSSRVEMRNIVITVKLNGDVEYNRLDLYRVLKIKQYCKIYYTNGARNVYAEGYVETMEGDYFSRKEQIQISIVCPFPYFKSVGEIYYDISKNFNMFEFPFAIEKEGIEFSSFDENRIADVYNRGDVHTGCTFRLLAKDTVINPTITNVDTGEKMGLEMEMDSGDEILINTLAGEKSITLIRGTQESNIVRYLTYESSWLQLEVGRNRFFYSTEEGERNLYMYITYNVLYEGA